VVVSQQKQRVFGEVKKKKIKSPVEFGLLVGLGVGGKQGSSTLVGPPFVWVTVGTPMGLATQLKMKKPTQRCGLLAFDKKLTNMGGWTRVVLGFGGCGSLSRPGLVGVWGGVYPQFTGLCCKSWWGGPHTKNRDPKKNCGVVVAGCW